MLRGHRFGRKNSQDVPVNEMSAVGKKGIKMTRRSGVGGTLYVIVPLTEKVQTRGRLRQDMQMEMSS